jgi:hypothetical protein
MNMDGGEPRLFTCRICKGARIIKWTSDPQDAFCCDHCEDDELQQLCDSQWFKSTPFRVVMTKLDRRCGGWAASVENSFQTHSGPTPEAAFFLLLKSCGWKWDGRWTRWITS